VPERARWAACPRPPGVKLLRDVATEAATFNPRGSASRLDLPFWQGLVLARTWEHMRLKSGLALERYSVSKMHAQFGFAKQWALRASPLLPRQNRRPASNLTARRNGLLLLRKSGAGEGARTLDPDLGKVVLYH
jgi:hypothetical protein